MLQHFANPERPRIITRQYRELLADSEVGWLRDIYHPENRDESQRRQKSNKKSSRDSDSEDNKVSIIDLLTPKGRASKQSEVPKDITIGEEIEANTVQDYPQSDEELDPNVATDDQTPHTRRDTRLRQKPDIFEPKTPLRIRKRINLKKRFPAQEGRYTEDHLDSEDSHIGEHGNSEGHRGEHPDKIDRQEANLQSETETTRTPTGAIPKLKARTGIKHKLVKGVGRLLGTSSSQKRLDNSQILKLIQPEAEAQDIDHILETVGMTPLRKDTVSLLSDTSKKKAESTETLNTGTMTIQAQFHRLGDAEDTSSQDQSEITTSNKRTEEEAAENNPLKTTHIDND